MGLSPDTPMTLPMPSVRASRSGPDTPSLPAPWAPRSGHPASTTMIHRTKHHPARDATRDDDVTHRQAAAAAAKGLSLSERAELCRQGAKAAARGEAAAANPMHRHINSPEATGESANVWAQRSQAWQDGHDAQSSGPGATRARVRRPDDGDDDVR